MQYYNYYDLPLLLIVVTLSLVIAYSYQKKKEIEEPFYRYFTLGLFAKIGAVIVFCFVYTHYYKGGDTLGYHQSAVALVNLALKSPAHYFSVLFGELSLEKKFYFDSSTGYPSHWSDVRSFNVSRFASFFEILGFKSFIISSILISIISYLCIWKLYYSIIRIYPNLSKQLFFAIVLMPSTLFWGSGILKDTISLMGVSLFASGLFGFLESRKKFLYQFFPITFGVFLILLVKPYIFVGLIPPFLLFVFHKNINAIKNGLLRMFVFPLVLLIIIGLGIFIWNISSAALGLYSNVNSMLLKAKISQEDLKREYYDGNSFDIGEYDASISGVLSKFPAASIAGLLRPFFWEAKNFVMFISGLENLFLLILIIYSSIKNPLGFIQLIKGKHMIVTFSILFSILFAFSIGISTSNFGALVRFKIPLIPFFVTAFLVLLKNRKFLISN